MAWRALLGRWVEPGAVDEAVGEWIGWSLPPAALEIRESGWRQDAPGAWCDRCGESVGAGEATAAGCARCRHRRLPVDNVVRLSRFEAPVREWIHAVKYRCWTEMAVALGRRLGVRCRRWDPGDVPVCVVPMPMPWQRRLYRGVDHTRSISDGVAAALQGEVTPVLTRRNGPPQTMLSPTERRRNAPRGLGLRRGRSARKGLEGSWVVLVDDVRTTGASSEAAARLLRVCRPAMVTAAFVAVADDPGRRRGGQ